MTEQERLDALIKRVFAELGGRAENDDLCDAVVNAMTPQSRKQVLRGYVRTRVSSALRAKSRDGLAMAQNLNGTWTQLSLMSVDEYRLCVHNHNKLAGRHRLIAERYVDKCRAVHDVDISDELALAV